MSDSLKDILSKHGVPQEPPEVALLKNYIKTAYGSLATIKANDSRIIIEVDNAPLAGTLRLEIYKLQELSGTKKRLYIRII